MIMVSWVSRSFSLPGIPKGWNKDSSWSRDSGWLRVGGRSPSSFPGRQILTNWHLRDLEIVSFELEPHPNGIRDKWLHYFSQVTLVDDIDFLPKKALPGFVGVFSLFHFHKHICILELLGGLEPVRGAIGYKAGYSLDRLAVRESLSPQGAKDLLFFEHWHRAHLCLIAK